MQLPLRTEEQIRFVTRFDDRFAEFWEELRKRNSHKLLGSRALDVLRWHFHYALEQNRVWILTANDGERLVSYAIFQRADLPQFGLKRMRLVDFQTLNGDRSSLAVMLGLAEKRCRAERIHMLEIYASDELINEPAIRKFAPYSRKTAQSPFFYKTNDAGLAKMMKDPAVWSPSPYDGDLTIGR